MAECIENSRSTSSCDLCCCDGIYQRVRLFVCSMNYIPLYLFPSRKDDRDIKDLGKHDFPWVLLRPVLPNAHLENQLPSASPPFSSRTPSPTTNLRLPSSSLRHFFLLFSALYDLYHFYHARWLHDVSAFRFDPP